MERTGGGVRQVQAPVMWRTAGTVKEHSVSANRQIYIVSYDVRDPKRLRETARTLQGYGRRIQKSVFRCRLSRKQMERLLWELTSVMDCKDDLLVFGLCDRCASKVRARGPDSDDEQWQDQPPRFVIL